MNIYKALSIVTVQPGYVLLDTNQANRRQHKLVKVDADVEELELGDAALLMLAPEGEENDVAIYRLVDKTQFKLGEVFGYDGNLNKLVAKNLKPVFEVEDIDPVAETESNHELDELVEAISKLDPENAAHYNMNTGKPETKILSGLLERKVTGKQRDAAWKQYQAQHEQNSDKE